MCSNEKVALVIPTLREARCIADTLGRARAALAAAGVWFEIIVVDDDSRDGTEQIVRKMSREDARIRLVVRHGERGLSGAILEGWRQTDASIVGVMDADLQHPPELLGELLAALHEGSDVAIASRYAPGLSPWRGTFRRGLSAGFTWVTRPLQRGGKRVGDPLSGFFLVRSHCVENIPFRRTGFKLLLEILVRGRVGSVREVPYTFGRRAAGRSKASLPVAWDYLQLVVQLYREQVRAGRIAGAAAD